MVHLRFTGSSASRQNKPVETISDVIHGKTITTKLSLPKLRMILGKLTREQKELVRKCGFGTILDLKCSQLPRDLGVCLARWFDCDSRTVNVPNVGSFEINAFTVHQILGIPLGGRLIDKIVTDEARRIVAEDTGARSTGPSIVHLTKLLTDDLSGDKFVRVFLLIVLSTFICPTSHPCASPDYFNGIAIVDEIPNYDWCSFALEWLVDKIRQFQISLSKPKVDGKEQSVSLGGCLLIPVVTFFDYLDSKHARIRNCIPRLPAWDDNAISAYDNLNLTRLKLKDVRSTPFVQRLSRFSSCQSLPNGVSQFIDMLIPSDDHANFREKMKGMCIEFYKTSLDTCFDTLQPLLAKQMCMMVQTIWSQVNDGASSSAISAIPPVHEFTTHQANTGEDLPALNSTTQHGSVPTAHKPTQQANVGEDLPAGDHSHLVAASSPILALGGVNNGQGDAVCHGDTQDINVEDAMLILALQAKAGVEPSYVGSDVAQLVDAAPSSEGAARNPMNEGNTSILARVEIKQGVTLGGNMALQEAEFVECSQQMQLTVSGEGVAAGTNCASASGGVDPIAHDLDLEHFASAGVGAENAPSRTNAKSSSIRNNAGKSIPPYGSTSHAQYEQSTCDNIPGGFAGAPSGKVISDEHSLLMSSAESSRVSKRPIDVVTIGTESESDAPNPSKMQKTEGSSCRNKDKSHPDPGVESASELC